jgi:multiple sugar transport system permease protein
VLGLGNLAWLSDANLALYAVAITDIWMWAPFVMLLSLAGLSAVPQHLYEAAAIDRAGSWYTFFHITLPLVSPLLLIALIFRTMEAFKTFDIAYILSTQPTTELVSIKLYKFAFQEWQTGKSCALAYIVLIMVLAITNIYVKYLNKAKER